MLKCNIRTAAYLGILVMVVIGGDANAQDIVPDGPIDMTFLFRSLLAVLISLLIWIARNTDVRLGRIEKRINEFNEISVARKTVIDLHTDQIRMLLHEQKQHATLISMQREMMLTKYVDKEDTERHRQKIEDSLAKQGETLNIICRRLDTMARPTHRHTDDGVEHG